MSLIFHPSTQRTLDEARSNASTQGYVFHGEAGIGKGSAARALARSYNCAGEGNDGCGVCGQIDSGTHPSLLVVAPTDKPSIGVGAIRSLTQSMSLAAYSQAGRRIVIVEAAEMMTDEAQNALLKLIEEPPAATSFILLATQAQSLLPTVLSRLGVIHFAPVPLDELAAWLASERGLSLLQAREVAAQAAGSPSRALGGLDSSEAPVEGTVNALVEGTLFARLIAAVRLAATKPSLDKVATALHAHARDALARGVLDATAASRIMDAALLIRRHARAHVLAKSALERFVLGST